MFGDLDWPINASRRFVSDSWVSCSIISSCCLRVYLLEWCDFRLYKVVGLSNTWQFLNSHCLLRKSQKTPKARLHLVNQNKTQAETQISINQSISLFQEQTHKNWDRRKDSGNIQRLLKIQWTDKNVLQINTHNNVQSVSQSIDQDWKRKDFTVGRPNELQLMCYWCGRVMQDGGLVCVRSACPVLNCLPVFQQTRPGHCCPVCTGSRTVYDVTVHAGRCYFRQQVLADGHLAHSASDLCTRCVCTVRGTLTILLTSHWSFFDTMLEFLEKIIVFPVCGVMR